MKAQAHVDKILRLTVRLEMLSKTSTKDIQKQIKLLQKDIAGLLATKNVSTKKVLEEVKKNVKKYHTKRFKEINKLLGEGSAVAAEISTATEAAYFASLGVVADAAVAKTVTKKVIQKSLERVMPGLSSGAQVSVGEMLERFESNALSTFTNIAVRAQAEGLSIGVTSKMVQEATNLQLNQSEAVARTIIQASSNQARDDIAQNLGAERELWLATLDSNTCPYCAGLDGSCEDVSTLPRPPAHPRCRCVLIYIPEGTSCKSMKEDLDRPQRGPDGKSIIKPYQEFGSWIKTQPPEFQEEVLGIERAKMLRENKVTFKKMYTNTGKQKTVADLKKHYS